MIKYRIVETWLGPVAYVARRGRLAAVYLPAQPSYQIKMILKDFPGCRKENGLLDEFARQLSEYFAGRLRRFSVPFELGGTPFRRQVLRETLKIPFGKTTTYGTIAERIGKGGACRAVGGALGANPLALVIRCHRVIAANGGLGGFSGGIEIKRKLLEHERRALGFGILDL